MINFTYLIYTHEEYSDIFDIHYKRLNKHYPDIYLLIATNNMDYILNKYESINKEQILIYDDNKTFSEKISSILKRITTKYILFNCDNNILVNDVNSEKINEIISIMDKDNIDQVRMFVSGISNPIFDDTLIKINTGPYYYSVNSALWNVNTLLHIMDTFKNKSYREIECDEIQKFTSKFNNYYLSSPNDIIFTGEGHYLSHWFPICHCISHGKWVTKHSPMNKKFIDDICNEYNIDLSIRGQF
jgi:hypothetical protein